MTDFDEDNSLNKIQKCVIKDNLDRIEKHFDKIYKENNIYFHTFYRLIYTLKKYLIVGKNRRKIEEKVD